MLGKRFDDGNFRGSADLFRRRSLWLPNPACFTCSTDPRSIDGRAWPRFNNKSVEIIANFSRSSVTVCDFLLCGSNCSSWLATAFKKSFIVFHHHRTRHEMAASVEKPPSWTHFYFIFISGGIAGANLPKAKKWHGSIEMCNTRVKNYDLAVCLIVVNSLIAPLVAAAELFSFLHAEEVQTVLEQNSLQTTTFFFHW